MKKNKGFLIVTIIAVTLMLVFFLTDGFLNLIALMGTDSRPYAYPFLKDVDKTDFTLEAIFDFVGLIVCVVGLVIAAKKDSSENKAMVAPLIGISLLDLLGIIGPIVAIVLTKKLAEENGYMFDTQVVLNARFFITIVLLSLSFVSCLLFFFLNEERLGKIKKVFGIIAPSATALSYLIVMFLNGGSGAATYTFGIAVLVTCIIMAALFNKADDRSQKEENASAPAKENKEEDIEAEPSVDDTDWMQ